MSADKATGGALFFTDVARVFVQACLGSCRAIAVGDFVAKEPLYTDGCESLCNEV